MRRLFGQFVLLLTISPVSVAAASIHVVPAHTHLVSERELAKHCGTSQWIYACTEFRGETLVCACKREGDRWRIHATAQLIPYIYLWQPAWMSHEMLHLNDIRASLTDYLTVLESTAYESVDACQSDGAVASRDFGAHMDEWKKLSNKKRHGFERAAK